MRRQLRLVVLAVLAVCIAVMNIGATPVAGPRLGIADISILELENRTVITAVDTDNRTVGRLDLVHGRFMPTEDFGPAFSRREVNGRKLFVEVKGQTIAWETLGFSNTRQMPPLPADLNLVAMFLADRRVKPILDKWRIGWAAGRPSAPARTPNDGSLFGTNPVDCSGLSVCPIRAGSGRTSLCAGGGAPTSAWVISQDAPTFGTEQEVVSACCPASAVPPFVPAYTVKTCSAAAGPPFISSCGISVSGGLCNACPGSPVVSPSCALSARGTGLFNAAGAPIYQIHYCDQPPGTPPTITLGPAIEIWPPNRKMHEFRLADFATAVDACDNSIDVNTLGTITSITSNEPEAGDSEVIGPSTFRVLADRNGFGTGRVYEIQFSVTDASGTSATAAGIIRVPRDRGGLGLKR